MTGGNGERRRNVKKTGFIGLGIMGNPMARNLLGSGVQLLVNDVSARAVERLRELLG